MDAAEKQHQDANHAHFTASEKVDNGLETVAGARMASIRNSFTDKGYGIFGMDRCGNASNNLPPRRDVSARVYSIARWQLKKRTRRNAKPATVR